jgi:hypothetical protein
MHLPDLTLPEPGSTTARAVLSRALSRLLADLRAVLSQSVDDASLRNEVAALGRAVAAVHDRAAVLTSIVRRPNVGALIRCQRANPDPGILRELVATLGEELTAIGAAELNLCAGQRVISLIGRHVRTGDAIERPFHGIRGELVLALADNNPLAMFEAHPTKSGNRIDLGGHAISEWVSALADALDRISAYLPDLRNEIDLFIQQFVPVGYDSEAHLSASYREAIGTIYLTLHPDAMTMTEAIIHEFSHNKLNALFELDAVMNNAFEPLFKSPVRPDPRPLHGVLLAVHAFIPVARLYELMIERDDPLARSPAFRRRYGQIVAGNHEGAEVLRNADPTPLGRELLDELARWDAHFSTTT